MSFLQFNAYSQKLSMDDLLKLSSVAPKSINSFLNKKGFSPDFNMSFSDSKSTRYLERKKTKKKDKQVVNVDRSIEMYKKDDLDCFVLSTTSLKEFTDGCNWLKKAGYFNGKIPDTASKATQLFQKNHIAIIASQKDSLEETKYSFLLQKKVIPKPENIQKADDLLKFTSHEYLVYFFGRNNVKSDVYYFSTHELKQCSVLFPNSDRQAIFIWNDENNLTNLSYILISGIAPTVNASNFKGSISQNKWTLKNGIYSGMTLKELSEINGEDFGFYGRLSDYLYMVPPENNGKIDFKKVGLTLGCFNCTGASVLDKIKVSARDAMANSLALYVVYIMVMP